MTVQGKTLAFLIGMGMVGAVAWAFLSPLLSLPRKAPEPAPAAAEQAPAPVRDVGRRELMRRMAARPDRRITDPFPMGATPEFDGQLAAAGNDLSGAGRVVILATAQGERFLRLEGLEVTNGPDLMVLLAEHPAPTRSADMDRGWYPLGRLKGNQGHQNYPIPEGLSLDRYRSVAIWSELFEELFAAAPLHAVPSAAQTETLP